MSPSPLPARGRALRPALLLSLPVAAACQEREGPCPEVSPAAAGPAVVLSWTSEEPATSRVEFTLDGEDEAIVAPGSTEPSTSHEAVIIGPEAGEPFHYAAITEIDGKDYVCEGDAEGGELPEGMPELAITPPEGGVDEGRWLVGTTMTQPSTQFIVDRDGGLVWARVLDSGLIATQMALQDGRIYGSVFGADRSDDQGQLMVLDLAGEQVDSIPLTSGHHSFARLPDGTVAYLALDAREWTDPDQEETVSVVGDQVVVIPPGGEPSRLFTVWDWLPVEKSSFWDIPFYTQGRDWTHGNSIWHDPEADTYLVSLGAVNLVLEIDATTGEPLTWYNGNRSDVLGGEDAVQVFGGSKPFQFQHGVRRTASGSLLMTMTDGETFGIEYEDQDPGLYETWNFGQGLGDRALAMGGAVRFGNGNTLVNWGTVLHAREVTPDGEVVWEMTAEDGLGFGYFEAYDDLYRGE